MQSTERRKEKVRGKIQESVKKFLNDAGNRKTTSKKTKNKNIPYNCDIEGKTVVCLKKRH